MNALDGMNNTGIVLLAAGSSTRFGGIKQLLPFHQKTLLQHTVDEALASAATKIVVVTGANADLIAASLENYKDNIEIIFNDQWQQGKASGIVAGVRTMGLDIQNIIIAVCDQPFVSASLFICLNQKQADSGKSIVASAYADTLGTPVLFTRKYFDRLLALKNEEGAKQLILSAGEDVAFVDFPQGHIDIDTKADYERLLNL